MKQSQKARIASQKNINTWENKQKASSILIGAILLAFFIMLLTEIDL